jgi:hypothetical protein
MEITPELEEIIISSIESRIADGKELTITEFLLCSDELKKSYINKKHTLLNSQLKLCSEDVIKAFIDMIVLGNNTVSDEAFNIFSDENKMHYVSLILPLRGLKLNEEQFFYIPDKYKIEYIMYRGFGSIGFFCKEWYTKWKKAMGRDHRIDLILLED